MPSGILYDFSRPHAKVSRPGLELQSHLRLRTSTCSGGAAEKPAKRLAVGGDNCLIMANYLHTHISPPPHRRFALQPSPIQSVG